MIRYCVVGIVLVLLAGCAGKKTTTVVTPSGSVTSTEDASGKQTTQYKGEGGEAKIEETGEGTRGEYRDKEGNVTNVETGKGVDYAAAGIPVYPGAQVDDEGKAAAQVTIPEGTHTSASFTTSDPMAKVLDWYAGQLTTQTKTTTPEGGMVTGTNKAGDQTFVVVGSNAGKTTIGVQVTRMKK